jgi:hypothetical protein
MLWIIFDFYNRVISVFMSHPAEGNSVGEGRKCQPMNQFWDCATTLGGATCHKIKKNQIQIHLCPAKREYLNTRMKKKCHSTVLNLPSLHKFRGHRVTHPLGIT